MDIIGEIGLGGGCHWCTEAVFQSINGVTLVEQGYIASIEDASEFSEAVVVHYNKQQTNLDTLIYNHLQTHECTAEHTFR